DDPTLPERPGALAQSRTAVRADIVISRDGVRGYSDDQYRLIADIVDGVVAHLRDLVQTRSSLPYPAPQAVELQASEGRIDVSARADPMLQSPPCGGPGCICAGRQSRLRQNRIDDSRHISP